MAKHWAIETIDKTLKDIMDSQLLFGGNVIVFGEDISQVLLWNKRTNYECKFGEVLPLTKNRNLNIMNQ